jgi:hypothetical protein
VYIYVYTPTNPQLTILKMLQGLGMEWSEKYFCRPLSPRNEKHLSCYQGDIISFFYNLFIFLAQNMNILGFSCKGLLAANLLGVN